VWALARPLGLLGPDIVADVDGRPGPGSSKGFVVRSAQRPSVSLALRATDCHAPKDGTPSRRRLPPAEPADPKL
jgi:hypothetical protein